MPDRPVIYRDRSYDPTKRPRGMDACPGPHPDRTAWKQWGDPFCRPCLFALPEHTRHLVTTGIPPGAWVAYRDEVLQQIRAGKPLDQIHITTTEEQR